MNVPGKNVLFVSDGAYRVGSVSSPGIPHPTLDPALANLREKGGLILAVPSQWCMCATIDVAKLPRTRRKAMLYRLEDKLPLPVEGIVADFIESGESALGIAGQLRLLHPIVSAVEEGGFSIEAIVPVALLAAQSYLASEELQACDLLMFPYEGQLELLQLANGCVTAWDTFTSDAEDAACELGVRAMGRGLRVVCGGVEDSIVRRLQTVGNVDVTTVDLPPVEEAVMLTVYALASRRATSLIDLWRDPLGPSESFRGARHQVLTAAAAAILLVVTIAIAISWRSAAYRLLTSEYDSQQREIFSRAFPNKSLIEGLSVPTQLLREERRLLATAGGGDTGIPDRPSSLFVLQRVLAAIPPGGACQVDELRLNDDKIWIEGTVPTHADATTVATSLAKDGGFAVEPPRTEQVTGGTGVAMTLSASLTAVKGKQR
ncbi:MAG: hypothetical protein JWM57_1101 [Phycisphaerales bacterium]|nr:hypothetical protein [Phycisphaerales bacterium]